MCNMKTVSFFWLSSALSMHIFCVWVVWFEIWGASVLHYEQFTVYFLFQVFFSFKNQLKLTLHAWKWYWQWLFKLNCMLKSLCLSSLHSGKRFLSVRKNCKWLKWAKYGESFQWSVRCCIEDSSWLSDPRRSWVFHYFSFSRLYCNPIRRKL